MTGLAFTHDPASADDRPDTKPQVPRNHAQFALAPQPKERLDRSTMKCKATFDAAMARSAARPYAALTERTESGSPFLVHDDSGSVSPSHLVP